MRVFVDAPDHLSRAMHRVAQALRMYAPRDRVEIVRSRDKADFEVLHVIGLEALERARAGGIPFAVIQYCVHSAIGGGQWQELWEASRATWSYYMLNAPRFYHAPLGVDADVFRTGIRARKGVMTSGYVTGPGAEAIEEVARAAEVVGMPTVHLGPVPVRAEDHAQQMPRGHAWRAIHGVSDEKLAEEYAACKWVSGLRYIEGFELPVIEGLACGARPVVFDRPDMRQWYDGHAVFVPECSGQTLIDRLVEVFSSDPVPVSTAERAEIVERFNWSTVANGFWSRILETA